MTKKFSSLLLVAATATLVVSLTACGSGNAGSAGEHAASGKLTIGVGVDRPGVGIKNPDGTYSGFDIDTATFIAGKLGVAPSGITWKEAPSAQRETLLQNGQVDLVVSLYSITDSRKEKVDFAGPYLTGGQSLLVRTDDNTITGTDSLNGGKRLCAPTGSVAAQNIKNKYSKDVQLQQYDTNGACVEALKNGAVDAVTTDDLILAGYAASSHGRLKLVGAPFTVEKYGIGIKKGDNDTRAKVNDAIEAYIKEGAWQKAFDVNFGASGYRAPQAPTVDRY
jgi:glutamate transport system substrate-binding protein